VLFVLRDAFAQSVTHFKNESGARLADAANYTQELAIYCVIFGTDELHFWISFWQMNSVNN